MKNQIEKIVKIAVALGYEVPEEIELTNLDGDLDGVCITQAFTGKRVIKINTNCSQDVMYVTAHEIGHYNDNREFDIFNYISVEDEGRKSEMYADEIAYKILKNVK